MAERTTTKQAGGEALETGPKDALALTVDRFWETLPKVWGQVRGQVRAVVGSGFDITIEQFHTLRTVRRWPCSISDLAAALYISRPAVSQAVDALVEKGLLTRTQSRDDRRFVVLELTSQGEALVLEIFGRNRAWLAARLETLEPEEIEDVQRGLEALKNAFAIP